jgi:hypothetical protein
LESPDPRIVPMWSKGFGEWTRPLSDGGSGMP